MKEPINNLILSNSIRMAVIGFNEAGRHKLMFLCVLGDLGVFVVQIGGWGKPYGRNAV